MIFLPAAGSPLVGREQFDSRAARDKYLAQRGGAIATTVTNAPPPPKGPFVGLTSGIEAVRRGNAPVLPKTTTTTITAPITGFADKVGAQFGLGGTVVLIAMAILVIVFYLLVMR